MAKVLDRATVNSFLRGPDYPLSREGLVELARLNNVPDDLLQALRELPPRQYRSMDEVVEELGRQGLRIS